MKGGQAAHPNPQSTCKIKAPSLNKELSPCALIENAPSKKVESATGAVAVGESINFGFALSASLSHIALLT